MEIKVSEFVETSDGGYFKHYTRYEDFPDTADRHCNLCIACGFPGYPKCVPECQPQRNKNES